MWYNKLERVKFYFKNQEKIGNIYGQNHFRRKN